MPPLSPPEVDYIRGRTRLFGIVGHPIEQVRSPEMFSAEFRARGLDAIMVPLHVTPDDFDVCIAGLMRLANLGGLIFTVPHKARAMALAQSLGDQAKVVGAINALVRTHDGRWRADIFDGLGCVEGFRRRGLGFGGKRVMLLGAGGAGSAIGVAIAYERPASMRLFDLDAARAAALADKIRAVSPATAVTCGAPATADADILLNATTTGMLDDARLPLDATLLRRDLVVFDAIVKPDRTPLLAAAEALGATTVYGKEMMGGQIARMVDFFYADAR